MWTKYGSIELCANFVFVWRWPASWLHHEVVWPRNRRTWSSFVWAAQRSFAITWCFWWDDWVDCPVRLCSGRTCRATSRTRVVSATGIFGCNACSTDGRCLRSGTDCSFPCWTVVRARHVPKWVSGCRTAHLPYIRVLQFEFPIQNTLQNTIEPYRQCSAAAREYTSRATKWHYGLLRSWRRNTL